MKKEKPKTYCKTCKETVPAELCEHCNKVVLHSCLDCHKELAHGIVEDQNIHIIGGSDGKLGTPEYDEDAFKRSDQ